MRWRFLTDAHARRLICAYGTRIAAILGDAKEPDRPRSAVRQDLTGAEVRYLMTCEWARSPRTC